MPGDSEDVAAEQAVACPGLNDGERAGAGQQCPEVKQLHRQQRAECGMNLRGGVVVGQRVSAGAGVVAAGPVKRGGHIFGKGNGAAPGDAAADGALGGGGYGVGAGTGGHSCSAGGGGANCARRMDGPAGALCLWGQVGSGASLNRFM